MPGKIEFKIKDVPIKFKTDRIEAEIIFPNKVKIHCVEIESLIKKSYLKRIICLFLKHQWSGDYGLVCQRCGKIKIENNWKHKLISTNHRFRSIPPDQEIDLFKEPGD
jgi:hypothetical protein